ncbi:MAG: putative DNA-binding domain-containing protein [Pseudomonadales bacterium]
MSLESVQQQLASHIRNPVVVAGPAGIEQRRLKIYSELFYKNIENFISSGFPILRQIIADEPWHAMVRDFMVHHQCHTPYFLEISQEFLLYLQNDRQLMAEDPGFMLELAHYEWVELAVDIASQDLAEIEVNPEGDLLEQLPLVSPLAWSLAYQYPVYRIGVDFQPQQPSEQPVYLIVYRNCQDQVGFMEANAITARLLELLQAADAISGSQVLQQLALEIQHPHPEQVLASGTEILQQLRSLDILLGTV